MIKRVLLLGFTLLVILPLASVLLYGLFNPPATPLMAIRTFEGYGRWQEWRDLEEIDPDLRFAVIAAEDNLFCEHKGFDLDSLSKAIEEKLDGGRLRGASTISMQTTKNLYLWPGRSYLRKALEWYGTLYLETLLDKERILELYLNIVEFGPGIYGAEAAAQHFYGQSAGQLSRDQATRLAAVLPNPLGRHPGNMGQRARTYATRINQLGPLLDCVRLNSE